MDADRARVGSLLVLFLLACGGRTPSQSGHPMIASEIRFSLPAGVVDETPYRFGSDEQDVLLQEELTVDHDQLPDGVTDLDGLVRYRLEQLKGVTQGEVKLLEDTPGRIGPFPARRIHVEQSSGDKSLRTLCLLAIRSDRTYLQLTYSVPPRDTGGGARFDRIAGTVRLPDQDGGPHLDGFVHRRAGVVTLDVPSHLMPPSDYRFALPDDAGSIEAHVWRRGDAGTAAPLATLLASDSALAERMSPALQETLTVSGGTAEVVRYTLTNQRYDQVSEIAVRRARVQFNSGTVIAVTMRAPQRLAPLSDRLFVGFVLGLREE